LSTGLKDRVRDRRSPTQTPLDRRRLLQRAAALGTAAIAARPLRAGAAFRLPPYDDGTDIESVKSRPVAQPVDGELLPTYRLLTYYGFPTNPNMGILGEYGVNDDLDGLRDALVEQAAGYEAADPTRPVLPGFEIIASVAQAEPMSDGSYLVHTDAELVQQYVDYTAANDMPLFLDYQFGRTSIEDELAAAEEWMSYPHVHLALDPEFKMLPTEVPGVDLGAIDAADVTLAQEWLADFAASNDLPPKVLVVHQFFYTMIQNKEQLAPVPGVQLVIDMDGHGPPWMKADSYGVVITQQPIEFHGMKLFYPFDDPLLTPEEVLAFSPPPDMVIYQ
jgi:hypothetical protein